MAETPPSSPRIALVEDDEDLARSTAQLLRLAGFEVEHFPAATPALAAITADWPGVVAVSYTHLTLPTKA